MKIWQCAKCRAMTEDLNSQCYSITDDDVIPTNCLRDNYIIRSKEGWEDDDGNPIPANRIPDSFPITSAEWSKAEYIDIKDVIESLQTKPKSKSL